MNNEESLANFDYFPLVFREFPHEQLALHMQALIDKQLVLKEDEELLNFVLDGGLPKLAQHEVKEVRAVAQRKRFFFV